MRPTRSLLRAGIAIGVYLALAACAAQPQPASREPAPLPEPAGASGFRPLAQAEDLCTSCVEATTIATLGDGAEGLLQEIGLTAVERDGAGNFWVSQRGPLKVYGPSGTFLRDVGRRGEGPLEFQIPNWIFADSQGRVHVFDAANSRESIIGPDFELLDERPFVEHGRDIAAIDDVARLAVSPMRPAEAPIRIVEGGEVVAEFGLAPGTEIESLPPGATWRRLTQDDQSRIVSIDQYAYRFEVWTPAGGRLDGLEGPELNPPPVNIGPWSQESPPIHSVFDLQVDSEGLLRVGVWIVRPDWRDHVDEVDRGDAVYYEPRDDDVDRVFDTRIDFIDLARGEIVARFEDEGTFIRLLSDDLAVRQGYDEIGDIHLDVVRLTLRR